MESTQAVEALNALDELIGKLQENLQQLYISWRLIAHALELDDDDNASSEGIPDAEEVSTGGWSFVPFGRCIQRSVSTPPPSHQTPMQQQYQQTPRQHQCHTATLTSHKEDENKGGVNSRINCGASKRRYEKGYGSVIFVTLDKEEQYKWSG